MRHCGRTSPQKLDRERRSPKSAAILSLAFCSRLHQMQSLRRNIVFGVSVLLVMLGGAPCFGGSTVLRLICGEV